MLMKALPYWIEHDKNNIPMNYIWVKIPKLYGNEKKKIIIQKSQRHKPNIFETFIFANDFESDNISDYYEYSFNKTDYSIANSKIEVFTTTTISGDYFGAQLLHEPFEPRKCKVKFYGMRNPVSSAGEWGIFCGLTDKSIITYFKVYNATTVRMTEYSRRSRDKVIFNVFAGNGIFVETAGVLSENEPIANKWVIIDSAIIPEQKEIYCVAKWGNSQVSLTTYGTDYMLSPVFFEVGFAEITHYYSDPRLFLDWYFMREYADIEPKIEVFKSGNDYEVIIENPNNYNLTNYSVPISLDSINITSASEGLEIWEYESKKYWLFTKSEILRYYKFSNEININSVAQDIASKLIDTVAEKDIQAPSNIESTKAISKQALNYVDVSARLAKHVSILLENTKKVFDYVSNFQEILNVLNMFINVETNTKSNISEKTNIVIENSNELISKASTYIETSLLTIKNYFFSTLVEIKSEISGYLNTIYETTGSHSKQITPVIETCNDILQSITSALEITKSFEAKLNKILEILRQVTQETSVEVDNERSIEFNLNILTEIVESASELIQILRTVGEKITIFRTTIDILRHTDN